MLIIFLSGSILLMTCTYILHKKKFFLCCLVSFSWGLSFTEVVVNFNKQKMILLDSNIGSCINFSLWLNLIRKQMSNYHSHIFMQTHNVQQQWSVKSFNRSLTKKNSLCIV